MARHNNVKHLACQCGRTVQVNDDTVSVTCSLCLQEQLGQRCREARQEAEVRAANDVRELVLQPFEGPLPAPEQVEMTPRLLALRDRVKLINAS